MSAPATVLRRSLRRVLGIACIVGAVCLVSWAAFHLSRAPSECGSNASPCPAGLVPALLGGFVGGLLVLPLGFVVVGPRNGRPWLVAPTLALLTGGVAASVYVSRFVADPITDATVATNIVAGIFATVSLLFALATVLPRRAAPPA